MKIVKRIIKVLVLIIVICLSLFILNYIRINLSYSIHKKEYKDSFPVYGNTNHYIPQGLTYSDQYEVVLQTSYNSDHKVSKLFVIDFYTGNLIKELDLLDENGKANNHHVGGITTNNKTVWISNDYEIEEYSLEEIINTDNTSIRSTSTTKLPIRGDFCTYHDDMLWIGDFYLKPFYDVPNGNPLLLGYSIEEDVNYKKPVVAISLPKMVQGLTFNDKNEFIFTESFTYLIKSNFSIYENILKEEADVTIDINDNKVPYYDIKHRLKKTIKMPPMAEELFYLDGEYYILFENSTDSYSLALPKMKNVIKYKIDKK